MGITLSEEQILAERACTRGACHVVHFNNAGCSLPPDQVLDAVTEYLHAEALEGG